MTGLRDILSPPDDYSKPFQVRRVHPAFADPEFRKWFDERVAKEKAEREAKNRAEYHRACNREINRKLSNER
jgi:hypothetical protein